MAIRRDTLRVVLYVSRVRDPALHADLTLLINRGHGRRVKELANGALGGVRAGNGLPRSTPTTTVVLAPGVQSPDCSAGMHENARNDDALPRPASTRIRF